MSARVILSGYMLVADEDLPAVLAALPAHIELTRQEDGCLIFEVNQGVDNKNRFDVYEQFRDRTAFETHQQRVRHSEWGRVSARVERHYTVTETHEKTGAGHDLAG